MVFPLHTDLGHLLLPEPAHRVQSGLWSQTERQERRRRRRFKRVALAIVLGPPVIVTILALDNDTPSPSALLPHQLTRPASQHAFTFNIARSNQAPTNAHRQPKRRKRQNRRLPAPTPARSPTSLAPTLTLSVQSTSIFHSYASGLRAGRLVVAVLVVLEVHLVVDGVSNEEETCWWSAVNIGATATSRDNKTYRRWWRRGACCGHVSIR
jgi:hypothetical protein